MRMMLVGTSVLVLVCYVCAYRKGANKAFKSGQEVTPLLYMSPSTYSTIKAR